MFDISTNGIVHVNRGDSFELPVNLIIGDAINRVTYQLQETDVLYVGIMEPNQPFETALIRKRITRKDLDSEGNIKVRFWPKDTVCVLPGKYYYQIKIETTVTLPNGEIRKDVETVVDKTLFYIQE